MQMQEYLNVKDMSYRVYCSYLQNKYGIGLADYMTKSYNDNPKCKRTKEGLFAHHLYEDEGILLSDKVFAKMYPFEWQEKQNIVYCDYLEHLLLHILIFRDNGSPEYLDSGLGGAISFIIPELNDIYSGWQPTQNWKINVRARIIDDKNVYLAILKLLLSLNPSLKPDLYSSRNEEYGVWSAMQNGIIFSDIDSL